MRKNTITRQQVPEALVIAYVTANEQNEAVVVEIARLYPDKALEIADVVPMYEIRIAEAVPSKLKDFFETPRDNPAAFYTQFRDFFYENWNIIPAASKIKIIGSHRQLFLDLLKKNTAITSEEIVSLIRFFGDEDSKQDREYIVTIAKERPDLAKKIAVQYPDYWAATIVRAFPEKAVAIIKGISFIDHKLVLETAKAHPELCLKIAKTGKVSPSELAVAVPSQAFKLAKLFPGDAIEIAKLVPRAFKLKA